VYQSTDLVFYFSAVVAFLSCKRIIWLCTTPEIKSKALDSCIDTGNGLLTFFINWLHQWPTNSCSVSSFYTPIEQYTVTLESGPWIEKLGSRNEERGHLLHAQTWKNQLWQNARMKTATLLTQNA
jgi:hypothetical protein